ncbi:hypothetical protein D3233_10605 [Staphylococcus aureus]|nr:hypothetical protein C9J77_06335 [Staphylococcus aureus]NAN57333.1 hypothetical protein [Staphylococcus aureus]NAN75204.1 hypothetical protein [Staphylococcus aureus]PZL21201.1 hypothetical protein C7Q09_05290 [Staphylococcus aureus]RDK22365.1 hypothetical protein DWQ73_08030 [Staphylococcus aureus]
MYYFSILVRGPNTENFEKKFYKQCKLGWGPTKRNWIPNFNRQCNLCMINQHYSFNFTSLN